MKSECFQLTAMNVLVFHTSTCTSTTASYADKLEGCRGGGGGLPAHDWQASPISSWINPPFVVEGLLYN